MEELIAELRNSIYKDESDPEDNILMSSQYKPISFDIKNFHSIIPEKKIDSSKNHSSKDDSSNTLSSILFVDGGNSILFDSAGLCLGFIRVCGLKYENNVRVSRNIKEFHILITEKNGVFAIKTFPESSFNQLVFKPDDRSLMSGIDRSNPSKIVSVIRRFAEIEYAAELDNSNIDFILLDGTLEARYPFEMIYLKKLLATGKACALSKTCSLTTKKGLPVTKKLSDIACGIKEVSSDAWYYHPITVNNNSLHDADIFFVKLNKLSKHVFRFETQKSLAKSYESIFNSLYANSSDPVFIGYPYGFVDVDSNARVSEEESKMLQTKISIKLGKEWNEFSRYLSSLNAHQILDKLRF